MPSYRFQKYYKSLFLSLVDMALVNCYIIHNLVNASKKKPSKDHFSFLNELHEFLVKQVKSDFTTRKQRIEEPDFTTTVPSSIPSILVTLMRQSQVPVTNAHVLCKVQDVRINNGVHRLRQRVCKVCSSYKVRK